MSILLDFQRFIFICCSFYQYFFNFLFIRDCRFDFSHPDNRNNFVNCWKENFQQLQNICKLWGRLIKWENRFYMNYQSKTRNISQSAFTSCQTWKKKKNKLLCGTLKNNSGFITIIWGIGNYVWIQEKPVASTETI